MQGNAPRDPKQTEGATRFAFANQILLENEGELHSMLDAARASIVGRLVDVTRDEVVDYAASREACQRCGGTTMLLRSALAETVGLLSLWREMGALVSVAVTRQNTS